jgi:PAS domain S-box-containing protein
MGATGRSKPRRQQQQVLQIGDNLFALSLDLQSVIGFDGRFKQVNAAWNQTLGFTTEELLAKPYLSFVHPDDRQMTIAAAEQAHSGVQLFSFVNRYRCKNGSYRWLQWTANPSPSEQLVFCSTRDITEQKKAEEIKAHFVAIVESSDDAIISKTLSSIVTSWNTSAERLFGYSAEEMMGKSITVLIPPDRLGEETHIIDRLKRGERVTHFETIRRHKDGHDISVSATISPIKDANDRVIGASQIVRDITRQKEMETELIQAKSEAERANQAKSEFLSRMSHELRTPLNAILGFGQLLELDALNPDQLQSVRHILKGGQHLLSLINEVLDIAQIEAGRMTLSLEPVQIDAIIGEAADLVRPLADARKIQLRTPAIGEETVYVRADRQRLKQVLMNLLSNGVKYNRKGGTLTVSHQVSSNSRHRITVTDTGGGIPPALLTRLFTPFDRLGADANTEGTGLGLVLTRNLMTAMGGTISVDSVVDQGTSFFIDLVTSDPPSARPAVKPAEIERTARVSGTAFTVLYIEDNLPNYHLIERLIARQPGVGLISAIQGQLGVELASMHRPDLVLLDLNLPDMSGEEVLLRLREHPDTATIPVIMLSAVAMPKQIEKLMAAGAKDYLTKPIDVNRFLALLNEMRTKKEVVRHG